MYQLLDGIRVLDLTTVVLGPFATNVLGEFGAEVIKLEAPDGDLFRSSSPARSQQMGAGFININRNKQSVVLNLKDPLHYDAFLQLVDTADVLVHNMRPSAIERLRISHGILQARNPNLVYCWSTGYGSNGPYRDEPAYDDVLQGRIGLAALLGQATGEPQLAPTVIADKVSGLYLTNAVLAALLARERAATAPVIEVPMFEAMTSFMLAEHMGGRLFDPPEGPVGYNRLLTSNRRPHATADGHIVWLPYSTRHWQALFELMDRPDLAAADWVTDPDQRTLRADELYGFLAEFAPTKTTSEWLAVLSELDIPAAALNSLDDLFDDDHLNAVGFFEPFTHPTEGDLTLTRSPAIVHNALRSADAPAPRLGADTAAVLAGLGISEDEVAAIIAG